ncbi:hypothetical protein NC653_006230 [Populus alba x Populus x berolinensis]|uniref:Uncharacterized protein n=1 Tax=Populus alba x Populus x berolinensis TaxID=444605 RepID=A0AAD6RE31_9ROSI|nr:hypothetical protein NC653_006230 [Populus alba x Populus x berolinensis]
MPGDAELAWLPSLRNSRGVRLSILRIPYKIPIRISKPVARPEEERSRRAPKVWPRKNWKESEDDGNKTQYCYEPHINTLEDAATREGAVAGRSTLQDIRSELKDNRRRELLASKQNMAPPKKAKMVYLVIG